MNSEAFDKWVLPMKERIFRLAKTMLYDVEEAEDVTQDILEKLWRKRSVLSGVDNTVAYVYKVARNACLDHMRRRKVRPDTLHEIHLETVGTEDKQMELRDLKTFVERMISDLPEKQQIVIHLRDIEGYGFDEIAGITGMPEPTARVMLSRARKTIREKLIKVTEYGS